MFAATADDDDLLDSLRAGASGYLLKDTDPARLGFALRGVLNGEAAIPRQLVRRLTEEFRAPALPRFVQTSQAAAKLTAREWQVMELLGAGLTTDQVARRLFLSRSTVRVHVSSTDMVAGTSFGESGSGLRGALATSSPDAAASRMEEMKPRVIELRSTK